MYDNTHDDAMKDHLRDDAGAQETPVTDRPMNDFRRIASDTAYAAVGFAGFVGEKAKEFYDEQIRQYAENHPEASANDPGARAFLKQLGERLNVFVEDLGRIFRDMTERGRSAQTKETPVQDGGVPTSTPAHPGADAQPEDNAPHSEAFEPNATAQHGPDSPFHTNHPEDHQQ